MRGALGEFGGADGGEALCRSDFACIEAKLVVEIDGSFHDIAEQQHYDAERTMRLEALGWRVLRIRDALVISDASAPVALIVEALRQPSP